MRALVVFAPGGSGQLTAIQHPDEKPYRIDPATGQAVDIKFPNATTETMGQRWYRENLQVLNQAGFDVLAYDRRGEGISGGFSDTNTLEQGEDVFRLLAQLDSGGGLRVLMPGGRLLEGRVAAGQLLAGRRSIEIPMLLAGYSRGSMSTAWAMTKNFSQSCSYDMPQPVCQPAKGLINIKGAILLSSIASVQRRHGLLLPAAIGGAATRLFLVEYGAVVLMIAGDLHDRLVSETSRVAQPTGRHTTGRDNVPRQDGHVVFQVVRHLEGLEFGVEVGEDKQFHEVDASDILAKVTRAKAALARITR